MIQRMLAGALFAGCCAGLLAALLQFTFVEKLILLAEDYETGELVHFRGAGEAGHSHDQAAAPGGDAASGPAAGSAAMTGKDAAAAHAHHHDHEETSPLKRHALTVLFFMLTYAGYGLLLVAGFALAGLTGRAVTMRQGLLWGLAGFAAFQLAPAMGLSPELPGTLSAALEARQLWWALTAVATAGGLALIGYGRGPLAWGAAGILLALPHVIGAPEPGRFTGVTPPELAAAFAARTLGVGLIAWLVLGALAGRFWGRAGEQGA